MWEKLRIIFTIPELRQKILLTLLLLAIYRVGWWIPLPIVDTAKMSDFFSPPGNSSLGEGLEPGGHVQRHAARARPRSSAWASCPTSRPRLSSSCWPASGSRWKSCRRRAKRGRKKINEYTRYATVLLCLGQSWFYVRFLVRAELVDEYFLNESAACRSAGTGQRDDHDRRHGVSHVAGRADRRVRHRQRHQPADHGRHSGPHAQGRFRTCCGPIFEERPGAGRRPRRDGRRKADRAGAAVYRRGLRRGVHHAGPAPHSHAKRQARARPARVWRHAAVSAAAGESGRRHADHLRQQLADVPHAAVRPGWPATYPNADWLLQRNRPVAFPAVAATCTTCCTSC